MARKPLDKNIEAPIELAPEVTETVSNTQEVIAALEAPAKEELVAAIQAITRSQVHSGYEELSRVARISEMKKIKESKAYKALKGQKTPCGTEFYSGTWEEYCNLLGRSVDQVDHEISNLNSFGPEALEVMDKAGISYQKMRQLRRLPDDEKSALIEAAKTGDKDTFLDLAEEIVARNARKEEQLSLELNEAKAALEAKDAVAQNNARRINELQEKAVLIQKLPADEHAKQLCSEIASQQTGIDEEIRTNFYNALQKLVDHSGDDHQPFIDAQIKMLDDAVSMLRQTFGGVGTAWEQAE